MPVAQRIDSIIASSKKVEVLPARAFSMAEFAFVLTGSGRKSEASLVLSKDMLKMSSLMRGAFSSQFGLTRK